MGRALGFLKSVWRNRRQETDLPRFLTYIVTFTCNARCIMCDSWKKPSPDDLTLDEIERIFDELPPMDGVRLSGGEPFVRRDLLDIAHLAQDRLKPLVLHVTTNGFLTDRIVRFLEERRKDVPLQMLVSVDGVEDKHNQVRGHDQAWKYVLRTLEAIAPRQREFRMELAVNQTIVDAEGVEHYKLLRDELEPLGVRNNVVMAYDASATYHLDSEVEVAPEQIGSFCTFGEFDETQLTMLFDEIEKDLPRYPMLERIAKRYYLRGIRHRLLGGVGHPNPKCVALNAHMRMLPNGQVPTCQFNTRTVGSLRDQSFAELWSSLETERQRRWVRSCPGCWAECEVLPSAIYTGDLLRQTVLPSGPPRSKRAVPAQEVVPERGAGGLPVVR